MTRQILLAVTTVSLYAQTSHFQPPSWTNAAGSSRSGSLWQLDGQSGPVIGRPFSGTEIRHTTQVLADGTHVDHSDTSQFYRDAQGRMRNESARRAFIYDPVARSTYSLELASKTYQKASIRYPDGGYQVAVVDGLIVNRESGGSSPAGSRPDSRSFKEDLTPQVINGAYCHGSRITTVIPAGAFGNDRDVKVMNERWYSDDLKVLVKSTNSDPRFGISTYELTKIMQAPPDPLLFQVPPNFTSHEGS